VQEFPDLRAQVTLSQVVRELNCGFGVLVGTQRFDECVDVFDLGEAGDAQPGLGDQTMCRGQRVGGEVEVPATCCRRTCGTP
jgi:hypothetical protein